MEFVSFNYYPSCTMLLVSVCLLFWFSWNHFIQAEHILSAPNHVMSNHVIERFGANSIFECWVGCHTNVRCWSYNFLSDLGVCEINDESHITRPEALVRRPEAFYVANIMRLNEKCNTPLGMENGKIKDHQITQSSSLNLATHGFQGRLNSKPAKLINPHKGEPTWVAEISQAGEYLQIDLNRLTLVTMVATQGRPAEGGRSAMWVTKYKIAHSLDGRYWFYHTEDGSIKEFSGNTNGKTVVTNRLKDKILTRYIRFVVLEWHHGIAMRVEVYGCLPSN